MQVITWPLFGPAQEQVKPTQHTLGKWLYVTPPLTNKSPDDQASRSKVQGL